MDKKTALIFFLKSFFGKADDELIAAFEPITSLVKKEKKEIIFIEGQEGVNMYFVADGAVKLFRTNEEGKEAVIHFVHRGELFAEILLHLGFRYPVSSIALEPLTLLAINAKQMQEQLARRPELAMKIIAVLTMRLKYFVGMVENLTLADVRTRFLQYLRSLKKKKGGMTFTLPVPKGELALLLGTSPETFSRLLKKLSEEGLLEVKGRELTLLADLPPVG